MAWLYPWLKFTHMNTNPLPFDSITFAQAAQVGANIAQLLACGDPLAKNIGQAMLLVFQEETAGAIPRVRQKLDKLREARGVAAEERNRNIWREMHRLALSGDISEGYLDIVARRLSCGPCRTNFAAYRKSHPLTSDRQFEWTWELHNEVNRTKPNPTPEMTLEAAKAIYAVG